MPCRPSCQYASPRSLIDYMSKHDVSGELCILPARGVHPPPPHAHPPRLNAAQEPTGAPKSLADGRPADQPAHPGWLGGPSHREGSVGVSITLRCVPSHTRLYFTCVTHTSPSVPHSQPREPRYSKGYLQAHQFFEIFSKLKGPSATLGKADCRDLTSLCLRLLRISQRGLQ